jgi:hypothetical protein
MLRRVLLLLFGFPVLVWAQSYTASVRGIVTDQTQAAVPAAQVTLTDVNRNQTYTTMADSEGPLRNTKRRSTKPRSIVHV